MIISMKECYLQVDQGGAQSWAETGAPIQIRAVRALTRVREK